MRSSVRASGALLVTASLAAAPLGAQDGKPLPGYTDTPVLPGMQWRVHDPARPRPPVVTPAPACVPAPAPADAAVLFDGRDLSQWTGRDGKAAWKIVDGCAEVNGTGDIESRASFGDCQLHLEWCAPAPARGESQGRGNSGLFFMQRYEVQILDCFENLTYPDGQTAALYGQYPPRVNACRRPGEWQSYDVFFEAPRFDGERLARPARITVIHNGVLVHHAQEFLGPTGHRSLPAYAAHPAQLPLRLQDHGDPVRFRNIWVRPLR